MTKQQLSDWWAKRGDAWSKIDGAERALLESLQVIGPNDDIGRQVRSALGCLAGARELLAIASEFCQSEGKKIAAAATATDAPTESDLAGCRGEMGRPA